MNAWLGYLTLGGGDYVHQSSGNCFAVEFLCFPEVPGEERPPLRSALPRGVAGLPAPPPAACEEGALLGRAIELHGANQEMT